MKKGVKKNYLFAIAGLLILIAGIFVVIAAVNKTIQWHSDNTIKLIIDGNEKTLQQAVNESLLFGSHTYALPSSVSSGGHNADRVWVSVNGTEKTLINALQTTGLYGKINTTSYSGPSDKNKAYHYATEIEVNICGSKISLQEAIDNKRITNHSWVTGNCSYTCANGTRTNTCNRVIDGVQVADACCNAATKPSTICNPQPCVWTTRYPPKSFSKDYNCMNAGGCTFGSCNDGGGVNAHTGVCPTRGASWTCCTVIAQVCYNYAFDCK